MEGLRVRREETSERGPRQYWLMLLFAFVFVLSGCGDNGPDNSVTTGGGVCAELSADNIDNCLRLNHIQVLGTHNSYKLHPLPELVDIIDEWRPGWADNIDYGHRTLTEQFEHLGVRQIELDIFADPEGGLYAEPVGAVLVGDDAFIRPGPMLAPGFKVLHSQDLDYRSHCLTFVGCLEELRDWSLVNPRHFPIMVLVELKDAPRPDFGPVQYTVPVPIDGSNIMDVDAEIASVFAREHIITPDDVRGNHETLESAVTNAGWPTLAQSRGKVLFALDNTGSHRTAYLDGAPDLDGRLMFVSSPPGEPTAGFIKMNNVLNDFELIRRYSEAGFLIRTRSDIPTVEARSGDTQRRDHALESGARYVSTDYLEPSPFGSGYVVELPGAAGAARCNPVSAPQGCQSAWLVE